MYARTTWYADGLRWIGTVLNEAADRLERNPTPEPLEPQAIREIDQYLDGVRSRVHVHF